MSLTPVRVWALDPPDDDPDCDNFERNKPLKNQAEWHHSENDTDGCSHKTTDHAGTITVRVTVGNWICIADYFGSETTARPLPEPRPCRLR